MTRPMDNPSNIFENIFGGKYQLKSNPKMGVALSRLSGGLKMHGFYSISGMFPI